MWVGYTRQRSAVAGVRAAPRRGVADARPRDVDRARGDATGVPETLLRFPGVLARGDDMVAVAVLAEPEPALALGAAVAVGDLAGARAFAAPALAFAGVGRPAACWPLGAKARQSSTRTQTLASWNKIDAAHCIDASTG